MSAAQQPLSCPPNALETFGGDKDDPSEQQVASEALVILFTFAGLLLGAILREVSKKTKVPYTPLLIAAGVFIGIYITKFGVLGDAVEQALILHPHGILMIFIPTLIFESAFNADWYVLKKVAINVFLLAGPSVLINTFLLAFTLKVILQYDNDDLTWPGALTLSAIISTVDPISIVPLLKEVGAPVKFNLLAEGESLLNGGVAMVFYTLFLNMSTGNTQGAREVTLSFLQLAGGGPLLGFIVGVVASLWIKRITRDNTLSVTISFISCYLLFFAAETQLHVSGILALITLGLFISAYGKTKIDAEAENALHAVWSWAQYACETLIYLITGLLIGYEAIFQKTTTIETGDWYRMIVFYVFVLVARAVAVGIFFPILKKHGYSITGKEFIVLVWGGLKGALGLCLALMVATDTDKDEDNEEKLPRRMRELVMFYTTGMVLLTVLLNGTTCNWLIGRMEMVIEPEVKNRLQKNLITQMILQSREKEDRLKEDKFLNLSDWNAVTKLVGNDELSREFSKGPSGVIQHQGTELQDMANYDPERASYQPLKDDDMFQETRFRLLRIMKGIYWEKYEEGLLTGEAARLLIKGVNVSLDSTEKPIDLWSFLYEYFTSFRLIKFFIKMKDFFLVGRLARSYIMSHMTFIYEITTAFIEVCGEVLEIDESVPLSKNHIQTVIEEVGKNRFDAENYMLDLQSNFLEVMKAIQVKRAAYQILDEQKHFLEDMMHTGQIEEKEYGEIRRKIDRKLNALEDLKIDWHFPTFNEFVTEFPIFGDLTPEEARELQRESKQKTFHKGDFLYEMHSPCSGVFFVTKGRVTESVDINRTFSKGAGAILSFANLVNDQRKAVTTCEAFSDVQTTFIGFEKLDPILKRNEAFEEKVYKHALFTFFLASYDKNINKLRLNDLKINDILRRSKLKTYKEGDKFMLENGGFLFSGAITKAVNADENERFKANNFSLVPPNNSELSATKLTKILVFERENRDIFDGYGPSRSEERRGSGVDLNAPKKSVRVSFREAFQRDMFDKEFRNMMGKNKYDDYLS